MDEKHNWLGKFWENLENFRKFSKNSWRNLQKLLYFCLFCKEITKPFAKFSRVWTKNAIVWGKFEKILKIFDENSMEKLNFYLFLGKFVAKNRNFGNNIIFLQHFFRFWGVNPPPNPSAYATDLMITLFSVNLTLDFGVFSTIRLPLNAVSNF